MSTGRDLLRISDYLTGAADDNAAQVKQIRRERGTENQGVRIRGQTLSGFVLGTSQP
jgi:hypothetical protein